MRLPFCVVVAFEAPDTLWATDATEGLLDDLLGPAGRRVPNHLLLMARFGLSGLLPATRLAGSRFSEARAKACSPAAPRTRSFRWSGC